MVLVCELIIYQLRDAENLLLGFLRNVLARWRYSWSNSNCWWLELEFSYRNRTCIVLKSLNYRCICKSSLELLRLTGWKMSPVTKSQKFGNWHSHSTLNILRNGLQNLGTVLSRILCMTHFTYLYLCLWWKSLELDNWVAHPIRQSTIWVE